ncbi:hypothetical protein PVAP13_6KG406401 [Panicum virgatum]|uniref:Uncharacterized protein n=1 Tax=Panicum virgatum TaxID=38727 RepID=A0A8T0RJR4_PANVG|nr:hypothetical protein PVAP13_6KG406401 [Panicum virgatum]
MELSGCGSSQVTTVGSSSSIFQRQQQDAAFNLQQLFRASGQAPGGDGAAVPPTVVRRLSTRPPSRRHVAIQKTPALAPSYRRSLRRRRRAWAPVLVAGMDQGRGGGKINRVN